MFAEIQRRHVISKARSFIKLASAAAPRAVRRSAVVGLISFSSSPASAEQNTGASPAGDLSDTRTSSREAETTSAPAGAATFDNDEASASDGMDCFYAANANESACRGTDTRRIHAKHATSY